MRARTIVDHDTGLVRRTTVRNDSQCGKRVYSSRKDALRRAAETQKVTGNPTTAVHCHECHGFHLTPKVAG